MVCTRLHDHEPMVLACRRICTQRRRRSSSKLKGLPFLAIRTIGVPLVAAIGAGPLGSRVILPVPGHGARATVPKFAKAVLACRRRRCGSCCATTSWWALAVTAALWALAAGPVAGAQVFMIFCALQPCWIWRVVACLAFPCPGILFLQCAKSYIRPKL